MIRLPARLEVLHAACEIFGLDVPQVTKRAADDDMNRRPRCCIVRAVYCGMMREHWPCYSLPELAEAMGARTHVTAIDASRRWRKWDDGHEIVPGMTKADVRREMLRRIANICGGVA